MPQNGKKAAVFTIIIIGITGYAFITGEKRGELFYNAAIGDLID